MTVTTTSATKTLTTVPTAPTRPGLLQTQTLIPMLPRNELIERNRGLVGFALAPLLRRFPHLPDDDRADVTAAGLRALVLAADKYDPAAGVQFSTYAVTLIQFAGRKALGTRGEWKARKAGVFVGSLDTPIELKDGSVTRGDLVADDRAVDAFVRLLDNADETDRTAAFWAWIRANVTSRQLNALRLCYGKGKSQDEAALVLGKSRQCVGDRLQTGLAALRQAVDTPGGKRATQRFYMAE